MIKLINKHKVYSGLFNQKNWNTTGVIVHRCWDYDYQQKAVSMQ